MKVSGELKGGEATFAAGVVGAKLRGAAWLYLVVQIVLLAGGAIAGSAAADLLKASAGRQVIEPFVGGAIGLVVGWLLYLRFCRSVLVGTWRRSMAARGFGEGVAQAVTLSDEGVTRLSGDVETRAPWSSVSEVMRAREYWVLLVQMDPWMIPSRFFNDVAEERAFLREALSHLDGKARARSADAVIFARADQA